MALDYDTLQSLVQRLKDEEGFNPHPYTDTVGVLTIGYGRNLKDVGINKEEAEYLLRNEISAAVLSLDKRLPWWSNLTQNRQSVLVDMTFNMGIGWVDEFVSTVANIRSGKWEAAASNMLDSKWARQVGQRAHVLAQLIAHG